MNVLITAGATREAIDGIRFISNFSTGRTGAFLADFFVSRQDTVSFVHGRGSVLPAETQNIEFRSFHDLNTHLINLLGENVFDLILHSAAVSDFSVSSVLLDGKEHEPSAVPKINSNQELVIKTQRNMKIIDNLKKYSQANPQLKHPPLVVGFKLTNTPDKGVKEEEVARLASHARVDMIVHNDLHEMKTLGKHLFNVYVGTKVLQENLTCRELGFFIAQFAERYVGR